MPGGQVPSPGTQARRANCHSATMPKKTKAIGMPAPDFTETMDLGMEKGAPVDTATANGAHTHSTKMKIDQRVVKYLVVLC